MNGQCKIYVTTFYGRTSTERLGLPKTILEARELANAHAVKNPRKQGEYMIHEAIDEGNGCIMTVLFGNAFFVRGMKNKGVIRWADEPKSDCDLFTEKVGK